MVKPGDRVFHYAYGYGTATDREETKTSPIVQVKWDNPELGRFPEDKLPYEFESFWTDESQLEIRRSVRVV